MTENTARHCRLKILSETLETQDTEKLYDVLSAPSKPLSFGGGKEKYVCDGKMMIVLNLDFELFMSFLILVFLLVWSYSWVPYVRLQTGIIQFQTNTCKLSCLWKFMLECSSNYCEILTFQPEMNQQFNVPKGASLLLEFNLVKHCSSCTSQIFESNIVWRKYQIHKYGNNSASFLR